MKKFTATLRAVKLLPFPKERFARLSMASQFQKYVCTLADGDGFQCSSSSASNDDFDDELEPLLMKLCVYASLYASDCTRICLRTPRGACPQTPQELITAGWPCSLHQVMTFSPPKWKKLCTALISNLNPNHTLQLTTLKHL